MWIVRLALSRPYTFIVLAMLLFILGPLAIFRMPTDIFPVINIPVVSVVWNYAGLPPSQMGSRIVSNFERAVTTTVNDIEHIESESLLGVGVVKIFFQPKVQIGMAIAQVTAIAQTVLRGLPPGTTPPLILSYNASTVAILQLVLSSPTLSEQDLNDLGNNFIRTQLATVEGAAIPFPYGGKVRQIQVDLNPEAMQTYGVSAADISNAIGLQNLILPAGTEKIGPYEYLIKLNASPEKAEDLNVMPVRTSNGGVLYIRDVAHVRDGFAPQTNIVLMNGIRAVLMSIQKSGSASTLDIVNQIKVLLPQIKSGMPAALNLGLIGDQSIFVKAAIKDVVQEAVLAAVLTGLMILLFLGSARSTLIIVISIPLAMMASIIALSVLGETINIMTLGGLALAVGILVDDATVTIENINWNLERGKEVETAILDGAEQIAIPAFVSTLSICIVFVPMFFLTGVAHYLFVPLAEAVIFAMLASYFLSRTLVPTLAKYWLQKHVVTSEESQHLPESRNIFVRIQQNFEYYFDVMRTHYHGALKRVLSNNKIFTLGFLLFLFISIVILYPWIGTDFFPRVDAGQIKLHMRASPGTRVEETAKIASIVNKIIRRHIPASEIDTIVDNIGLPTSGINLSYSNSGAIGPEDADILVSLKPDHHSLDDYIRKLRIDLAREKTGIAFSFLPADIVGQTLNFGLPAPIDIQIVGFKKEENRQYALMLLDRIKRIPGIVDANIHQVFDYPTLNVDIDRSLAKELGYTQLDIASNVLISLSGSFQTSPTFWLSPLGVSYPIVTQTPQYRLDTVEGLRNILITKPGVAPQILGAVATIKSIGELGDDSHYNVQPVIDIFANIQDRDLGGVSVDINKLIAKTHDSVPKGSKVISRGQMQTQRESFDGLYAGLAFAIILVYFLIVVNFQSWIDPFIIITALPAAIAGIVWIVFLTHTTLSVPALTGAIMCMGVATANSILVVSFARHAMEQGLKPIEAALDAGFMRLRPVLMTASAMIIGMLPMALGLGEGGEQNAPLGRAVIGGLLFATFATLFFVPTVFTLIHDHRHKRLENKKLNR
jgi:multidrug efflux pump subunit AcrB